MEHAIDTYLRPETECLPMLSERVLCVSAGTEPYDDNGDYNWGD